MELALCTWQRLVLVWKNQVYASDNAYELRYSRNFNKVLDAPLITAYR